MQLLAIIPARGGSKGVPRKNIRDVAGKPLIAWTIESALAAGCLSRVVVSTDDSEIAAVSRNFGAEIVMRPAELARDDTPTAPVLAHVVETLGAEGWQADAVMTLQPTSPLRRPHHIQEAASLFAADPRADSLVSCVEVPHIFHPRSVMKHDARGYLVPYLDGPLVARRQDKEAVFARNGAAIYITRRQWIGQFVFGGNLLAYMMAAEDSMDIDTEEDLAVADAELRRRTGA